MDLNLSAEAILRDAGYETWTWETADGSAVGFEGDATIGFIHTVRTIQDLITGWERREEWGLVKHAPQLRSSGEKAWNIYTVLLTDAEASEAENRRIALIEEDLRRTRKIARAGVFRGKPIEWALGPILPLKSLGGSALHIESIEDKIHRKLKDLPESAVQAYLSNSSADDVIGKLREAL